MGGPHSVGGANKEDAVMAEGGVGGGGDCVGDLLSQFRCLGTTDRDVLINDLHSILGGRITREQCVFVLEMSNWNLQNAIGAYYDYLSRPSMLEMRLEGGFIDPPGPVTTGKQFYYVWTVINTGSDSWPSGVRLVFSDGHNFEGVTEGPIEGLRPREKRTITVVLKAPPVPGVYRAVWRLVDLEGRFFGEALSLELRVGESGGVADLTEQLSILNTSGHETVLNDDEGQVSTSNVMEGMTTHNHNHWSGGEGGGMNNE